MQASGVVLAGGASRRMGRDKALLLFESERLVDRAVACLHEVADDVVVASGRRRIKGLDVPQIPDQRNGGGPLSGLAAGLVHAEHEAVFVLAVDLPRASSALFTALGELWEGESALIPSAGGRAQPLHALWASSMAVNLSVLIADGVRSVMHAAETMSARILDDAETMALAGDDRWARHLDHPSDL